MKGVDVARGKALRYRYDVHVDDASGAHGSAVSDRVSQTTNRNGNDNTDRNVPILSWVTWVRDFPSRLYNRCTLSGAHDNDQTHQTQVPLPDPSAHTFVDVFGESDFGRPGCLVRAAGTGTFDVRSLAPRYDQRGDIVRWSECVQQIWWYYKRLHTVSNSGQRPTRTHIVQTVIQSLIRFIFLGVRTSISKFPLLHQTTPTFLSRHIA